MHSFCGFLLLIFAAVSGAASASARRACSVVSSVAALAIGPCFSSANAAVVAGQVVVAQGISAPQIGTNQNLALYVTVRQDRGIWQDRVRNFKSPPIMSKRIPSSELKQGFPLRVTLDSVLDATVEGKEIEEAWTKGQTPLLVSARLDVDGVAATRSPDDLTGSASTSFSNEQGSFDKFELTLVDRGITGKLITQTQQKR